MGSKLEIKFKSGIRRDQTAAHILTEQLRIAKKRLFSNPGVSGMANSFSPKNDLGYKTLGEITGYAETTSKAEEYAGMGVGRNCSRSCPMPGLAS